SCGPDVQRATATAGSSDPFAAPPTACHAASPFVIRKTSELSGSSVPHFRRPEGVQLTLGLRLALVGATGLEHVTPNVSSKGPAGASDNFHELTANAPGGCTSRCTSGERIGTNPTVEALTAAVQTLSPAERARLAALLLERQHEGTGP